MIVYMENASFFRYVTQPVEDPTVCFAPFASDPH